MGIRDRCGDWGCVKRGGSLGGEAKEK